MQLTSEKSCGQRSEFRLKSCRPCAVSRGVDAGLTDCHCASVSFTDTTPSGSNGSSMRTSSNRPPRFSPSKQQDSRNAVIRPQRSSSRAGSAAYSAIRARAASNPIPGRRRRAYRSEAAVISSWLSSSWRSPSRSGHMSCHWTTYVRIRLPKHRSDRDFQYARKAVGHMSGR